MNALAVSTTAMILSAGCVVQLDRFHPRTWWRDVVDSGATIVHYLGVMPAILMNLPETPQAFAYASVTVRTQSQRPRRVRARFGFPLIEAWAMTETGGGRWSPRDASPAMSAAMHWVLPATTWIFHR
jgi:hypothetical protein